MKKIKKKLLTDMLVEGANAMLNMYIYYNSEYPNIKIRHTMKLAHLRQALSYYKRYKIAHYILFGHWKATKNQKT